MGIIKIAIVMFFYLCAQLSFFEVARADTLADIRARGDLRCGVYPDDPGRSAMGADGRWAGFYVDFCRAVAAAVLGDGDAVRFVEVGGTTRFTVLAERLADVVMYSTTWTLGRERTHKVIFPAVYLFDGQGLMVRAGSGIRTLADLSGRSVCVTGNTTTHANLVGLLKAGGIDAKLVLANGDAFFRGNCDAYSADRVNLATNRASRADDPSRYEILPVTLSREPIGPMTRDDDPAWARVVGAVVHALILAEDLGLTRANVAAKRDDGGSIEMDNLLGRDTRFAQMLGLHPEWAFRAIRTVGHYGEVFERNFGANTPIGLDRGLNRSWSQGGVLYAPLFR